MVCWVTDCVMVRGCWTRGRCATAGTSVVQEQRNTNDGGHVGGVPIPNVGKLDKRSNCKRCSSCRSRREIGLAPELYSDKYLARVRVVGQKAGRGGDKAALSKPSCYVLCTMDLNHGMCKSLVREPWPARLEVVRPPGSAPGTPSAHSEQAGSHRLRRHRGS